LPEIEENSFTLAQTENLFKAGFDTEFARMPIPASKRTGIEIHNFIGTPLSIHGALERIGKHNTDFAITKGHVLELATSHYRHNLPKKGDGMCLILFKNEDVPRPR